MGQGFVSLLQEKQAQLRDTTGLNAQVVAVVTRSRGTIFDPDGLNLELLLHEDVRQRFAAYPSDKNIQHDLDVMTLIREGNADVVIEVSPSDLESAQPALDYCYAALDSGQHVILANKGPVVVDYAGLQARAQSTGRRVLCEATVMAGTPVLRVAATSLAGCTIDRIRGILNGTTNYILTEMENGLDYDAALAQAQSLGYAETDPTNDVGGWDAAGKAMILSAAVYGRPLRRDQMQVAGITQITAEMIQSARAAGKRWKLVAEVTADGGYVRPIELPLDDPLASVNGTTNALTYSTDVLGDVSVIGAGAGGRQTGYGLLADLLDIFRNS